MTGTGGGVAETTGGGFSAGVTSGEKGASPEPQARRRAAASARLGETRRLVVETKAGQG
jgi:hypothetical protein